MVLRKVILDSAEWDTAMTIYLSSFPEEERRPIDSVRHLVAEEPRYSFLVAKVGDDTVGFITTWTFDDMVYVEHLAVDATRRGANLGSRIIRAVADMTPLSLILEIEPVDEPGISAAQVAEREARLRFYLRLGFKACDLPYEQPPYKPGLPAIPLTLMEYGGDLLPAAIGRVTQTLHREVYGVR